VLCQGKLGEVLISLCYQPAPGLINVGVVAARSLKAKDLSGQSGTIQMLTGLKWSVDFFEGAIAIASQR